MLDEPLTEVERRFLARALDVLLTAIEDDNLERGATKVARSQLTEVVHLLPVKLKRDKRPTGHDLSDAVLDVADHLVRDTQQRPRLTG